MTSHSLAKIKLCGLSEILDLISDEVNSKSTVTEYAIQTIVAKEFAVEIPDSSNIMDVFIVARPHTGGLQLFCYKNQCPHTRVNLNWQPDQFLSLDRSRIQCSMHGALFRVNDGFCEWGPCQGRVLQNIQTVIENDDIFIML